MCQEKRYFVAVKVRLVIILTLLILTGWGEQLQAQQIYPTKPIDVIVPYGSGGSTDLTARVVADYLRKKWGVPVNVLNKPGGLAVPGCLEVYNAKPDGYTVLLDSMATTSLMLVSVKDLPFKIMERTFLGVVAATPYVYIVPASSPITNLKDLESVIKKDPSNFTWISIGGAGGPDYATRKFMKAIGVDILKTRPVISKGGAEPTNLTASGAVKLATVTPSARGGAIDGKGVRPLAVTPNKRVPKLPDVPTVAEAGYSNASFQDYLGVSGPPNMPSYIVEIWDKAMTELVKDDETIAKIDRLRLSPIYLNARETRELRLREIEEAKELYGVK